MPIYAYKCSECGHTKDALQKISDDPLTVCPACGAAALTKQVTAAGFQLKGAGWYVSDFRGNGDGANSGVGKAAVDAKPMTDAPAAGAPAPAAAPNTTPSAAPSASPAAASPPAASPASAPKSVASAAASTPAKS